MNEWVFENDHNQAQKAGKPTSLKDKAELTALADRIRTNHEQLKESLDRLQNSLDNLRLVTKYRVFDLEATRRENARLRKLLEGDDDREIP